ncbi:hypothetical protein ABK040_014014 [Willaertia magna]
MSNNKEKGTFGMKWKEVANSELVNHDCIWRTVIKNELGTRNHWNKQFDFLVDEKHKLLETRAKEMINEKLTTSNYSNNHDNYNQIINYKDNLLPQPPNKVNRKEMPPKKTKMEEYYRYTLPPNKINPNKIEEHNEDLLERKNYTLNPYTIVNLQETKKKKKHKEQKDKNNIILPNLFDNKMDSNSENREYGKYSKLEIFDDHYTKFVRKKFITK